MAQVDLAECRLPAKAPLPWAAAAQEIHELRAAGRALQLGLCDGKELCSFQSLGGGGRKLNDRKVERYHKD